MKRQEGQALSCKLTGRLEKVTKLIDKVVDGLGKLNVEEVVWSGWFVGEGVAQLIRGRCSTNEERLWGNLVRVAVLEGKMWQLNPNPTTLDQDCKIWPFDNNPL